MYIRNNFLHLAWYGGNNLIHFASADALLISKRAPPHTPRRDNFVHLFLIAEQKYALCLCLKPLVGAEHLQTSG